MPAVIVPTVTTDNPEVLNANLAKFSAFAKRLHVDASDGSFAPTVLAPISGITIPEGVQLGLHVMSARPSDHLTEILTLKPSLCIVHAEAQDDILAFFNQLKEAGIRTGIALVKTTFPGKVQEYIAAADHALIFAGELGKQGGVADMMQTEKVGLIRAIKPDIEIGWDGGANLSNVRALSHAGLNVINVGSAITQAADAAAMYQSLVAETDKRGVLI